MSFGFSVGDFLAASKLALHIAQAIKSGPQEYKELQAQAESMHAIFSTLNNDAEDKDSLLNRKAGSGRSGKGDGGDGNKGAELMLLVSNAEGSLREVEKLINKHSRLDGNSVGGEGDAGGKSGGKGIVRVWDAYQVGATDVSALCGKMTFHVTAISNFLVGLQGSALGRMERKIDQLYASLLAEEDRVAAGAAGSRVSLESHVSILSEIETDEDRAWNLLKTHLLEEGISIEQVLAHRKTIVDYTKGILEEADKGGTVGHEQVLGGTTLGTRRTLRSRVSLSLVSEEHVIYAGKDCALLLFNGTADMTYFLGLTYGPVRLALHHLQPGPKYVRFFELVTPKYPGHVYWGARPPGRAKFSLSAMDLYINAAHMIAKPVRYAFAILLTPCSYTDSPYVDEFHYLNRPFDLGSPSFEIKPTSWTSSHGWVAGPTREIDKEQLILMVQTRHDELNARSKS